MANELTESLFKAIDILAQKKIDGLQFDKTLVCSIESITNAQKGEYRVTDGSSHFLAYSENTKYSVGAKVYVNVPNGDMGNQKIITGKYVSSDNDEYYNYVSPMNDFIDITNNVIQMPEGKSLLANGDTKEILLFSANNLNYREYERLGLKANFQTWLSKYNVVKGSYGLKLIVTSKNNIGGESSQIIKLDSSDMYGNPYNFDNYYQQEKVFDISKLYEITGLALYFYQDSNFILYDQTTVPHEGMVDNLFVNNPYISFGYSLSNFTEDKVIIGTTGNLSYSTSDNPANRNLYMRWVHQDNNKFYSIDEVKEMPETAIAHWYRYKLEQNREDLIAGVFWKEIEVNDIFNHSIIPDYATQYDRFKVIIEYPNRKYINENLTINDEIIAALDNIKNNSSSQEYAKINNIIMELCAIDDSAELAKRYELLLEESSEIVQEFITSAYNVIISEKATVQYYESNILELENAVSQELQTIDLIRGLSITVDEEGTNGVYRLYDDTNYIRNSSEANKLRTLKANYNSVVTGVDRLDQAEEIIWLFPTDNTMIQMPQLGKEYTEEDTILDNYWPNYIGIRRLGMEITGEISDEMQLIETEQKFRIKEYYIQTAGNNTIYCIVKKGGFEYSAQATLVFGSNGANGTDYTFILNLCDDSGNPIGGLRLGETAVIKPSLYDYNNQPLDINPNDITYSWFSQSKEESNLITYNKNGETAILNVQNKISLEFGKFILKAALKVSLGGETDVFIEAYYPVGISFKKDITNYNGPTSIVYDNNGTNPVYYKDAIEVFNGDNKVAINNAYINILDSKEEPYYPKVISDKEGNKKLIPSNMYYQHVTNCGLTIENNDDVYWIQALLIIQNRFSSAMLNKWQGNLTIDEKNGTILSSMVGAGIKNDDNTFSGVLMGEVSQALGDRHNGMGLYGFDHSEQSYGFNINGTAFLGKSGKGRINFDGNKGTIQSGNYDENNSGMLIDLDDSYLNAYGDAGAFEMNMNAQVNKPLLQIKGEDQKTPLIYIAGKAENEGLPEVDNPDSEIANPATKYFIQSSNYNPRNKTGLKLDLQNSSFTAYGEGGAIQIDAKKADHLFRIESANDNPLINISGGDSGYFLRSDNYNINAFTGLNFDLTKGELTAFDFTLHARHKIENTIPTKFSYIKIDSEGNPYFQIHHASAQKYDNVPVFKTYEPNTYWYYVDENTLKKDTSSAYTKDRTYYNENGNALNIVDKNTVYEKNKFYILNESEQNSYFELVKYYVSGIQYYSAQDLNKKITVINNAYAYQANKFYTISSNNIYKLDTNENFTVGRIYFDKNHNEVNNILNNRVYKLFAEAKEANILYYLSSNNYLLDSSNNMTDGRQYYKDASGKNAVKIVDQSYEIFKTNTYYQKIIQEGSDTFIYVIENVYYENMQYYKDVIIDEVGNQTATAVKVASPDSLYYKPNTYYYLAEDNWELVKSEDTFNQDINYAIFENGNYNTNYFIVNSGIVYKPNIYYYISEESIIKYDLSTSYNPNIQYYLDIGGEKTPVSVIIETDTLKIFKSDTYYRYYQFNGKYQLSDGDYNPYATYYMSKQAEDSDIIVTYESVELIDNKYKFEPNKFYIYNENADTYGLAAQFTGVQYYILSESEQENNLINITKNKFELKSHSWDMGKRSGMHFDISGSGGYIEGYSEYTNTLGEVIRPKFILDWRKNRNPIDVNNGVFKVKWNGETVCTNIRATGGKIGGWKITNNQIVSNNIVLYASNELSAIYAGPNANKFEDFFISNIPVDTSSEDKSDSMPNITEWETLIDSNNKYFYVNNDGTLEAYMAQIQCLKARKLYVEEFYLGKKKVKWKNKKVVINTSAKKVSVLTEVDVTDYGTGGATRHNHADLGLDSTGYSTVRHGHSVSVKRANVVSSSSSQSDQIVYLG